MKHSIGGQFIKTGKEIFDKLDSKVNFSIPQNLMSYLGPKGKMDDRNLEITQDNFRLQIGKMDKQNETIYTKDILLPAIEYIRKKTPAEQKAIIQLRPDLAKSLANYDQKEEANQILSFEEEKQAILKIIKKYQKQALSKIEIISVAKQYPELFDILKAHGREGLYSLDKPILNKDKVSPRLLTEHIYWLVQHNPKLMKVFYDTKTPAQKEADHKPIGQNQSDYYSVVEVGVRLYEVLSGISIQGGIDRQSKYDNIIGAILSGKNMDHFKMSDFPELEELHNFCKEVNPDITFERLWIDTKGVREVVEKKEGLSKVKQYTRNTAIALATALTLFASGYEFSQYRQKTEKQKTEESLAEKDLSKSDISFYGLSTRYLPGKNMEEKQKHLNNVAEAMTDFMEEIYGKIENKEQIIPIVKDELLRIHATYETYDGKQMNERNIERLYHAPIDRSISYQNDFVVEELVPNNKIKLSNAGLNPIPYNRFLEYRDDFENTLKTHGEISVSDNILSGVTVSNTTQERIQTEDVVRGYVSGLKRKLVDSKDIGEYYDYNDYAHYHFIRVTTKDGKHLVLASSSDYSGDEPYTLSRAKEGIEKLQKIWNKNAQ